MELRRDPRMTCQGQANWPPQWKGPFGPHNPLPSGELGVLTRVTCGPGILAAPHCIIVMQWNHQEYFATLYFDKENFMQGLVKLLQSYVGRPIAEIGSLDLLDLA